MLVSPAKENTEAVRTLSRYDDNNRQSSQCTVADDQVNKMIKNKMNARMKSLFKKLGRALSYMFHRKGFLTKRMVVATLLLILMLYVDIKCHIWSGVAPMLLVILSLYVLGVIIIRYIELKREDEEMQGKQNETADQEEMEKDDISSTPEENESISEEMVIPLERNRTADTAEEDNDPPADEREVNNKENE